MKELILERESKTNEVKFREWLERFLEEVVPLERSYALALWRANTTGRKDDEERLAKLEKSYRAVFANAQRYRFLKALDVEGSVQDPQLARQLHLLRCEFEASQMDDYTLSRMVALRVEVESTFNNFRAQLGEEKVPDNRLRELLRKSNSSDEVRAAWESSKQIGPIVAPKVLELVNLRNQVARGLGYESWQRMALTLDEIDPTWLFALLDELEAATQKPFEALKSRLDEGLAKRFGIKVSDLAPWHYGDPFFQSAPRTQAVDLDEFYTGKDLSALTTQFYDGLGLDIRPVLDQSDLFERDGKCQHAFCTDIDRRGDVRVLCNLKQNEQWMSTMLHEFGHAVYDLCFEPNRPHFLRGPAHTLSTESIAMMFGRASKDRRFLEQVAHVDPAKAAGAAASAVAELRAEQLIFVRWAMVVVRFEDALYRDPAQPLDTLWWDLVERFQLLRRPEGRHAPDWATKIHIATSPVYYQNYILGELMASQLLRHLLEKVAGERSDAGVGALMNRREVGEFLRQSIFRPGKSYPWNEMLERACGRKLEVSHFLAEVTGK